MRKLPAHLPAIALTVSLLPGCILPPATSTGGSAAALGPDGVAQEANTDTRHARIIAGLTWLWSSYTALKARGVDVASLREAISEMQDVVQRGDLSVALSLYGKARAIVTGLVK
jgi:hypothetical protein